MRLSPVIPLFIFISSLCFAQSTPEKRLDDKFDAWLTGTIGSLKVEMYLKKRGKAMDGWYRYKGKKEKLSLSGTAFGPDTFELKESWEERISGVFNGILSENLFSGKWITPGKKKLLAFSLDVIQMKRRTRLLYQKGTAWEFEAVQQREVRTEKVSAEYYPDVAAGDLTYLSDASYIVITRGLTQAVRDSINKFQRAAYDTSLAVHTGLKKESEAACCGADQQAYSISFARNNVLTLVMQGESYCKGAAHPNHGYDTWSFDLRTGKRIAMKEILRPSAITQFRSEPPPGCSDNNEDPSLLLEYSKTLFREGNKDFGIQKRSLEVYAPMYDFHASFPCRYQWFYLEKEMLKPEYIFLAED